MSSFAYASAGAIIVKAKESTTASLFFLSTIAKVIETASHFHFANEAAGSLATLKASKGKPGNLTVITRYAAIFSFALNYSDNIDNFTFFIFLEQAIGKGGGLIQSGADNTSSDNAPTPPAESIADDSSKKKLKHARHSNKNSSNLISESAKTEVEVGEADLAGYSDDNFVEKGSFYDMTERATTRYSVKTAICSARLLKIIFAITGGATFA